MTWHSIDSQSDLDAFGKDVCWEDSSALGYFAAEANREFYPTDVCRDGYHRKNLHLICSADSSRGAFLELAFIQAERFSSTFLDKPYVQGRVDSLRRVILTDAKGETVMRCARMIYRFSAERPALPFEENGTA